MRMLLTIALVILSFKALANAEVSNKRYVQQSQHTSFLVSGFDGQSLISHCHLEWAPGHPRCYLSFENASMDTTNIFFDYNDLKKVEPHLVKALKQLHKRLLKTDPITGWNKYFHMFRVNDYQSLEELILQIETESLSGRFLLTEEERKIDPIASKEVIDEIFNVFYLLLMPYELRE